MGRRRFVLIFKQLLLAADCNNYCLLLIVRGGKHDRKHRQDHT